LNLSIYSDIPDKKLVSLYKEKKHKDIIGELYKRYTKFVFLVSMKYLKDEESSKDASMQIFEKLITDLLNHSVDNFKSWLYMVTRNHCLMMLRKDQSNLKNKQEYKKDNEDFMEIDMNSHLKEKETKELRIETVHDAVNQLNKEQKECIELFYLQGKSYQEVAEITQYSLKKVKSYIQNGKRNLKNILVNAGISELIIIILIYIQF
jgi:RNA polymerase sigma factor (sigma-70 family)